MTTHPDTLALQATFIREGLDPALVYSPPRTSEIARLLADLRPLRDASRAWWATTKRATNGRLERGATSVASDSHFSDTDWDYALDRVEYAGESARAISALRKAIEYAARYGGAGETEHAAIALIEAAAVRGEVLR